MKKLLSSYKQIWILILAVLLVAAAGLGINTIRVYGGWLGPLKPIVVAQVDRRYSKRPKGEIVFYGASNFRLWTTMEEDMAPYKVQNHGLGGATDAELMKYADKLLYPYEPSVVFIQTGSNDNAAGLTVEEIIKNKDRMYTEFRQKLPNTVFVVMSGLPLPGRAEYWNDINDLNRHLKEYCENYDNMEFIDATGVMLDSDGNMRPDYFIEDQIHLNEKGHEAWTELMLEKLEEIGISK